MRDFIDEPGHLPEDLKALALCIDTIPVSSSEVERGFSVMNLICTDLRTGVKSRDHRDVTIMSTFIAAQQDKNVQLLKNIHWNL